MKRCPACQKEYDDAQNFCLDDGTTLVSAPATAPGSVLPPENLPYNRGAATPEVLHGPPTAGPQWATPPPPYMSPPVQKRSPLPWFIVGALALIAVVVGIILATRGSNGTTSGGTPGATPTSAPGRTSTPPAVAGLPYNSPDGKFSVTLPPGFGAFQSQKQTRQTLSGPVDLNVLLSENSRGASMLVYSDFPEAAFEGRTPKKMLEDGRDGALRNINATLEKQEDLTVQGRTGITVYGSGTYGGKPLYVRVNFILDKPRAYQVGFFSSNRDELDKPDIEAFLNSFRIK
jgi:hypothetical protein